MASTTLVSSGSGGNNFEDFERDLEALLRDHQEQQHHQQQQQQLRRAGGAGGGLLGRPRGDLLDIHRSGSAPPTVEGSLSAIGSLFGGPGPADYGPSGALTEEEIRAHPEYLSYYYSNGNFNPRLPPPVLSREDWRAVQRFRGTGGAFGGIGDRRAVKEKADGQVGGSSLFSLPVGSVRDRDGARINDREAAAEWSGSVGNGMDGSMQGSAKWTEHAGDGLAGLPTVGLGGRRMNFADVSQEELGRPSYVAGHGSRSSGHTLNDIIDPHGISDVHKTQVPNGCETVDALCPETGSAGLVRVQSLQSLGSSLSHPIASAHGSSFVSADPQLLRRYPSPCLPSMRSNFPSDDISSSIDRDDIAAALTGLNLSTTESFSEETQLQRRLHPEYIDEAGGLFNDTNPYFDQNGNNPESESLKIHSSPTLYKDSPKKNGLLRNHKLSKIAADGQNYMHKRSSLSLPLATQSGFEGSSNQSNGRSRGSNMNGFLAHHQFPEIGNQLNGGGTYEGGQESNYLTSFESQAGSGLRGPLYAQYLSKMDPAAQTATLKGLVAGRNFPEASLLDMAEYKKAYHRVLLEQHKLQSSGMPFLGNSVGLINGYYDNSPALDLGLPYSSNILLPSVGSGGSIRQSDRLPRVTSLGRSATAGPIGSWNSESSSIRDAGFGSSLLGEFKTNKTRNFELLDIANHLVEFSADQHGSRFIQQKLETASVEEKNRIFPEILPCARALMTDVFGNYVIQKFFEHGTEGQRMQLAGQLTGHVLALSLQMYGCRVIQKALEVVDLEHQTQMVSELEGSVMKCVRDQNGNHVIQKCIECVPQERIQFIISCFYGHVVTLSTHPYGCRVIQRVLEHCHDPRTQDIMMQEILASVSTLAQDQYGNYVVQHVLQHGKPIERSAIISKLIGNIVDMSLQKFASNVIEKCLTHGSPEERQLLINEMLGSTDENEPLQALMKDQYGNYVVQKVLETCDDKNREFIVSRIKVHLNALKKYTYGKHIVARVEKLVATGERHSRGG